MEFFKNKGIERNSGSDKENKKESVRDTKIIGTGKSITESVSKSTKIAKDKFYKPEKYDRKLLDDGHAKEMTKKKAFSENGDVKDPYTNKDLSLTKSEAKRLYGEDWKKHLAEADHKVPLKKRHEQTKNNPWLTSKDIKKSSNSSDNMETVSREYNNSKRSRSNTEFVNDKEYLKKTGVELSDEGKHKAIESESNARKALQMQDIKDSAKNIFETGNEAGIGGMRDSAIVVSTVSGIQNIVSIIKGEKTAKEAIVDTAKDTGKAAATGYGFSSALTVISHTLSYSSSSFIRALVESNVPGHVITAVMVAGDTVKQYAEGKISTKQCMNKLQEKASVFAGGTVGGAIGGQILIPIPIVGAAVGSLVGSVLSSYTYNKVSEMLEKNNIDKGALTAGAAVSTLVPVPGVSQFIGKKVYDAITDGKEKKEKLLAEKEKALEQTKNYRNELKSYLSTYFKDYPNCFNEAFEMIDRMINGGSEV
ncbi:hypothetical protein EHW90_10340 [Lachnoanaerobaculum orale]|uniref:Uncharacterized protein n=1 Tax=Lachnoanaerobaculum orale TaxID=979627 RepID=A0A3P3PYQ6_9FIRM|nr:hypothetical protein [Lachnoanaerobaculum orale]RRJ14097.1 hypothetical protein EHW90_10340 [Lachnoanaerobaculum orale]